jgi:tripartite-type tricarboxylate transporter receptor subunit TctC
MKIHRRRILELSTGAIALPFVSRMAAAETYPTRPVRLIVTVPAGGSPDIIARLIAQWLSNRLGQAFVVENRPGASSNIGTEVAVNAAPDGYTLLFAISSNAIRRCRRKRSLNSSPTPRPIPARSTWRRPAWAARLPSPANCSR